MFFNRLLRTKCQFDVANVDLISGCDKNITVVLRHNKHNVIYTYIHTILWKQMWMLHTELALVHLTT